MGLLEKNASGIIIVCPVHGKKEQGVPSQMDEVAREGVASFGQIWADQTPRPSIFAGSTEMSGFPDPFFAAPLGPTRSRAPMGAVLLTQPVKC